MIALLAAMDDQYIRKAAKRGFFASVFHEDGDELKNAIEISLRRFADYHDLQLAFARRAGIEQAKGIRMSRNGITADQAFASLRDHSRTTGTRLVDVAAAIVESHGMLPSDGSRGTLAPG